jgi:hypothetical protein
MTAGRPRLGVSLSGADPRFLMSVAPLVDFLEVDPEVVAEYKNGRPRIQPRALELISDAAGRVAIVVHGTDLSIGSHNGYSTDYLRLLDELLTVWLPRTGTGRSRILGTLTWRLSPGHADSWRS